MSGSLTWKESSDTKPSKWIIYGLIDPRNNHLRYIGRSTKGLKRAHSIHSAKCKTWIISLLQKGLVPIPLILEEFEKSNNINEVLNNSEIKWINKAREEGANLTNMTSG